MCGNMWQHAVTCTEMETGKESNITTESNLMFVQFQHMLPHVTVHVTALIPSFYLGIYSNAYMLPHVTVLFK